MSGELLSDESGIARVLGGTTGEIGLMLLSLGVREVGAFVGVEGETETTFESTQVISEDVRVLPASWSDFNIDIEEGKRSEDGRV